MRFLPMLAVHALMALAYLSAIPLLVPSERGGASLALAERLERDLREKMLDRAQEIARRNGHRWTDPQLAQTGAVFEKWDLPPELGMRILRWENGGITYPMGVTRDHRAVLATAWPSLRQAEGAARLWRRAVFWLLLEREDIYQEFRKVHGARAEPEDLIRMYPTAYTNFTLDRVWKPRINRSGMKDFIIEGLKTGRGIP
jgi:hypothetical protein